MALYASKIISYAQGYALMNAMAKESGWTINNGGDRPDVARRLHHPQRASWARSRRRSTATRSWRTCCSTRYFTGEVEQAQAGWRRVGRRGRRRNGIPLPAMTLGPGLLRRLPLRPAARQPAAGPARLLRRPHLRAHRQAARPVLPHQLDRPRRAHGVDLLQRLMRAPDAIAPDGSEIYLRVGPADGATRASLCEVRLGSGRGLAAGAPPLGGSDLVRPEGGRRSGAAPLTAFDRRRPAGRHAGDPDGLGASSSGPAPPRRCASSATPPRPGPALTRRSPPSPASAAPRFEGTLPTLSWKGEER